MGDKTPAYVEHLYRLSENNPGASFILTYRPLEEVAESFEARAKDPEAPWLLGGFETGVEQWNAAMKSTCNFVKSALNLNVLILSYHEFFYDNQAVVPLLSRFLDIEIDQRMQEAWTRMSHAFETRRRTKEPLGAEPYPETTSGTQTLLAEGGASAKRGTAQVCRHHIGGEAEVPAFEARAGRAQGAESKSTIATL
jgi:hypothetical protein